MEYLRAGGACLVASMALASSVGVSRAEPQSLEEITVTATRDEVAQKRAPAAVTVINRDQLENGVQGRIGEALVGVPGVYMRGSAFDGNRPGNSVGTINMRGIPGAQRTLFLVDGIPFNSPLSGTIDYSLLPITGLDRIEVVPGPFSSLYGSQALGGVINLITAPPTKREYTASIAYGAGSAQSERVTGSFRDRFENGLGIAIDGAFTNSSGFRDESATMATSTSPIAGAIPVTGVSMIPTSTGGIAALLGDRGERPWWTGNTGLRLYYDVSADTRLTAGVSYAQSYNGYGDPRSTIINGAGTAVYNGAIRFTDGSTTRYGNLNSATSANPFLNFVPGGEQRAQTFVRGETRIDDIKIKADVSYTYTDAWFLSPTTKSTLTPTVGDIVFAGGGTYTPGPANRLLATLQGERPWNSWNTLIVGVQGQRDWFGRNVEDVGNFKDVDSRTGAISYHSDGWANTYSAFAQNKSDFGDKISLYLGGRYDDWSTAGATWQHATAVQSALPPFSTSYGTRTASAFSPKASLVVLPIEDITLRASVGKAFRTPDLLQMYSRSQTTLTSYTDAAPDLKPERVTSWETGGEWRVLPTGTKLRATYFENDLADFIYTRVVSPNLSLRTNAGAAVVTGVEAGFDQKLGDDWTLYGNVTRNWSRMTENTAVPADVGKKLPFTPDWMSNVGLSFVRGAVTATVNGRYVSKVFADDQNRDVATGVFGMYDPYVLLDAKIAYEFPDGVKFSITGKNLTDRRYYAYYLQPGRTIFAELSYRY